MSRALIQRLYDAHAFDAMLLDVDMRDYHVPFDDLTNQATTESSLRDAVAKSERVALTGVSGSGKSSVARYALDPPPQGIAPIWVPVAYKDDDVATDPRKFAQYLVDVISTAAVAANRIPRKTREAILAGTTDDINLPTVARKHGLGLTIKHWILQGTVARDVTKTVEGGKVRRSEQDVLERANDVLEAIKAHGLFPVLVMDDTDRLVGRSDPDRMIPAFFGSVLRAAIDNLHAGIVVAVQPFYLARDDYKRCANGLIERHIQIPEIPDVDGMAAILTARVKFANRRRTAADVFADGALEELYEVYRSLEERSVRRLLSTAHAALGRSQATVADAITVEHVQAGADDALLT